MGGRHYNRNFRNWAAQTPAVRQPRDPADVIRAEMNQPYDPAPPDPADGIVSRFAVEWVASLTGRS